MKISIGTEGFILHPSGVVLWPRHRMVIVSDLHLEKGSHFALRGFFIPPYDTHATLQRLINVCVETDAQTLLLLGDCFHDPQGYVRLDAQARADFEELQAYHPIWINGNHDGDYVPPGFKAYDMYERDGIIFRHIAEPGAQCEISGHFHPKIRIVHKGGGINRACFIEDGNRMILPAFGSYTGGLFVNEAIIRDLFQTDTRCHVLGERRLFSLNLADLRSIGE